MVIRVVQELGVVHAVGAGHLVVEAEEAQGLLTIMSLPAQVV
jgi:hypothetical protein